MNTTKIKNKKLISNLNLLTLILKLTLLSFLIASCAPATKTSIETASSGAAAPPLPPTETDGSLGIIPDVPKPLVPQYSQKLKEIASTSSCAKTNWISRGRSPAGYMKGMAISYARSLCRVKALAPAVPAAALLRAPNSQNPKKDVLAHYQEILARVGLSALSAGDSPVHATYVIGLGLGMKESSGKYCEGWDVAAGSDRNSSEAEAGLFQTSYDSIVASTELKRLYDEYRANPKRCLLDVYKEGVTCKASSILGTGAGAVYQDFVRKCPAFATEYAMTLTRILRAHFGPLNRQTAQVAPACDGMLNQVRQIINQNPEAACRELF